MITTLLTIIYDEARRLWYYRWTLALTVRGYSCRECAVRPATSECVDAWAQVLISKDTPLTTATQGVGVGRDDDAGASASVVEKTVLSDQNLAPIVRVLNPAAAAMTRTDMAEPSTGCGVRIRITTDQDDGLIEFHYTDTNPVRARTVVQGVLNAFISQSVNNHRQQLGAAEQFLDQQVAAYQTMLSDSQAKMEGFRKQHPVVSVSAGGTGYERRGR